MLEPNESLVRANALPYNPATLATGADPQKWHRWDGRPSPHVPSSRHLRFARSRLQEIGCVRMLDRYRAQHGGEALYLAIDWVQAGVRPPERQYHVRWVAMLAHFNEGRHIYRAEDGTANAGTVASAVTGGGALVHGKFWCARLLLWLPGQGRRPALADGVRSRCLPVSISAAEIHVSGSVWLGFCDRPCGLGGDGWRSQ